jgi:hypothetical protein
VNDFHAETPCPQCGRSGAAYRFHGPECDRFGPAEHMHRQCGWCGHEWPERTRELRQRSGVVSD